MSLTLKGLLSMISVQPSKSDTQMAQLDYSKDLKKGNPKPVHIQASMFWMLASMVRRGRYSHTAKRYYRLSKAECQDRIDTYMSQFIWNDIFISRLEELQNEVNKRDKRDESSPPTSKNG